jgi:hypothetical protein
MHWALHCAAVIAVVNPRGARICCKTGGTAAESAMFFGVGLQQAMAMCRTRLSKCVIAYLSRSKASKVL